MEGGPSKINPAVSQAKAESKKSDSKEIQKAQPTAQKMPTETAHENNKDMAHFRFGLGGICAQSRRFMRRSKRKAATAKINSQACFPRKLIKWPAVRKTKLTTAPRRPGRMSAIFLPSVLRPFPTPLATPFKPFESELRITPRVVPTASKTAVTVKLYFLNIDFTFSLRRSLSESCSISLSLFHIRFHFVLVRVLFYFPSHVLFLQKVYFHHLRFPLVF